ncbi:hypothetical protein [Nocardia sp. NPDC051463]|uniref:hypothetical protein n=1 Tax=Nocardia sp. NPDC051463 TaxID=3154845 RepID=UPI00344BA896
MGVDEPQVVGGIAKADPQGAVPFELGLEQQLLETGLAAIELDHPVSLTDAIRALAGLRKSA